MLVVSNLKSMSFGVEFIIYIYIYIKCVWLDQVLKGDGVITSNASLIKT